MNFINRLKCYPWLSLVTFGAFLVLCGLCYWQIDRLLWKRDLIRKIEADMAAPALPVSDALVLKNLPEFRRVIVEGNVLNHEAFHLQARYYKGNLGFHLITPMRLTDGTFIFLNRGWVPKDYKTNPKVKITKPDGLIKITGIIRGNDHPRSYLPQNEPEKSLWLWQDADAWRSALLAKRPNAAILPVVVQQIYEQNQDDGFPLPQNAQFTIRNDHLEYAITWGSFALILAVIYAIYTRK